ncbi:TPA: hypothetical protein ACH3X2_000917 [Trebouxia sp. C0005]|nr:MAG: serine threonine- kinase RIO1-like [Trebouxia sp. A1-2]
MAGHQLQDDYRDQFKGLENMDSSVMTAFKVSTQRQAAAPPSRKDKSDRATVEQALDPRTRMILFRLLNSGYLSDMHGCISTGKEANVYHASTAAGADLAIKIYKTSILVFKDRDRYVSGDFRFRASYSKHNPRKMVKVWAEKERRNLVRLQAAGIRSPQPLQLRSHVLIMDFIGTGGVAAPRLKDADLSPNRLRMAYTEMVMVIRKLYQDCRLVHGDLSEYNILFHEDELWIIDVSQAVDLDHPRALDFLKEDAAHINAFFRRVGIAVLTTRQLFDFAVDPSIDESNLYEAVETLQQLAVRQGIQEDDEEEELADRVFEQAYIPRRLEEVEEYERDHDRLAGGQEQEGIYYQGITGMKADMSGARTTPKLLELQEECLARDLDTADLASSSDDSSDDDFDVGAIPGLACLEAPLLPAALRQQHDEGKEVNTGQEPGLQQQGESDLSSDEGSSQSGSEVLDTGGGDAKADRKAHKKAVKEANRERRKHKMPKHVKKKKMAKSHKK